MYKKIIFSLILVLSLFITKDAFALTPYYPYKTDTSIYDSKDYWYFESFSSSTTTDFNYMVVYDIDTSSATYGFALMSEYIVKDNYSSFDDAKEYNSNENVRFRVYDINNTGWDDYGDKLGVFMCNATAPYMLCNNENVRVDGSESLSTMQNSNLYYLEINIVNNKPEYDEPLPPTSDIDKVSLYTLNNQDLSEITTPIPFDAGHEIFFFNYEENPYRYLVFNMTICHNGQLEGCTVSNETFFNEYIDISSYGFSSSGSSPFSFKINFKDVVSQGDLINMSWQLSNCPNYGTFCPEGVSVGRGYTYLINNSLASDSWLTFDDPARPECSIARLDVCLINAVNYFIKPRTSGFANSFSVASTRINERIPFVYIYAVRDAFSEIFNSPTASVNWSVSFGSLGSLTVLDSDSFSGSPYYSFFAGMRVYLSYLLWILLGVGLYKRAIRLFDDKTVA